MANKLFIPAAIIAAVLSSNAFAHGGDRDGWREHRHHHRWERSTRVETIYVQPQTYYRATPVVYQERVVYQPAPTYVRMAVYPAHDSSRVLGQTIGVIAGGLIGSQIGHGQFGPTAIGAVVGGVVGGNLVAR